MKKMKKIDFKFEGKVVGSCRSYWHDKAWKILQSFPLRKMKKTSIHCSNCGYQLSWINNGWIDFLGPIGITPCPKCFPGLEVKTILECQDCGEKKVFTLENPKPHCTSCPDGPKA